ncbi:hypothetical protein [Kitasatospora sp. CB02891]|uniref:hypothetical protein n=1 Tax=Kitasatospora sp. CB02891 TaxID=2020329 RepID=UPI0012FE0369|nr:hypothetical protein [Kitasatospora sp. CB02891]
MPHPDALPESERPKLKSVLAGFPELDALTEHVRTFEKMLAQLQGDKLPQWIKAVRADDLLSPTPSSMASNAISQPSSSA